MKSTEQTVEGLIKLLADKKIKLWCEDDRLCFSAPEGVMDEDLKVHLSKHKQDLLEFLAQHQSDDKEKSTSKILMRSLARDNLVPASVGQMRLWHVCKLDHSSTYHLPLAVHIKGHMELVRLQSAFQQLLYRHEAFRTRFVEKEGRLYQYVESESKIETYELKQGEQELLPLLMDLTAKPLDVIGGDIGRAYFIETHESATVFLLVLHHLITDGWSSTVIMHDLMKLYHQKESLLPLTYDFIDFVDYQQRCLDQEKSTALEIFWKEDLKQAPSISVMPGAYIRPAVRQGYCGTVFKKLSPELTQHLEQFTKTHQVSVFSVLGVLHALLMYFTHGQRDVVLGTVAANRQGPLEMEQCIGFFANTLACRFYVSPDQSFLQLVQSAEITHRQRLVNQSLPFDRAVELSGVHRDAAWTPLIQTVIAIQNFFTVRADHLELTFEPMLIPGAGAHFDWALQVFSFEGSWLWQCGYDKELFTQTQVEKILSGLIVALNTGLTSPTIPVEQLMSSVFELLQPHTPVGKTWAEVSQQAQAMFNTKVFVLERIPGILSIFVEQEIDLSWEQRESIAQNLEKFSGCEIEIIPVANIPLSMSGDIDVAILLSLPAMPLSYVRQMMCSIPGVFFTSVKSTSAADISLEQWVALHEPLAKVPQEYLDALQRSLDVKDCIVQVGLNAFLTRDELAVLAQDYSFEPVLAGSSDQIEEKLYAIWCDVLGIDTFGLDDNFFAVGGTSMLLAQVHQQVQRISEQKISLVTMYQYPTISSMGAHIRILNASSQDILQEVPDVTKKGAEYAQHRKQRRAVKQRG